MKMPSVITEANQFNFLASAVTAGVAAIFAVGAGLLPMIARAADQMTIAVTEEGAAGRVNAPVSMAIQVPVPLREAAKAGRLILTELSSNSVALPPVPAQFEPETDGSSHGLLWWLMPPGLKGDRLFRLSISVEASYPTINAIYRWENEQKQVNVFDGKLPVLRYNFDATQVPRNVRPEFARGDYISPLYGTDGQVLTEDYPADHEHHRAVNWSWATILWKGEMRDLFAVRGIWARPVRMNRIFGGPVLATIDAESEWKWDDEEAVMHEQVVIRAFRQANYCRFIDIDLRLTPLVDQLEMAGRLNDAYSGFCLRMAPAPGQNIVMHNDPPEVSPRHSWADYSANFIGSWADYSPDAVGAKGRSGVSILQHMTNPMYPSEWMKYPGLNFYQPAFPGGKPIPMPKGKSVSLKYRLWIHTEAASEEMLADLWTAYNNPPEAKLKE